MKNLTERTGRIFPAVKLFAVHKDMANNSTTYIQAYDIDDMGFPINAHPLSLAECTNLIKVLDWKNSAQKSYLKPEKLLPKNVIYINPEKNGFALWTTPPLRTKLFFSEPLGIENNQCAFVPALLWKAYQDKLYVYALLTDQGVTVKTPIYHAPFFNIYRDGKICFGNVEVNFTKETTLEKFISKWQAYFFNSFFTGSIDGHNPVQGQLTTIWKNLLNTNSKFPVDKLSKSNLTIENLIS